MGRPKTIFELDLEKIARRHTELLTMLGAILLTLVATVGVGVWAGPNSAIFGIAFTSAYWLLIIAIVVVVIRAQLALGASVLMIVLYAVLTVFVSLLALIACLSQAGTVLRLGGAKIGFLGVSASERAKLRPGHCRGCGYDRRGLELLQPCPECNRVPQVI